MRIYIHISTYIYIYIYIYSLGGAVLSGCVRGWSPPVTLTSWGNVGPAGVNILWGVIGFIYACGSPPSAANRGCINGWTNGPPGHGRVWLRLLL